METSHLQQVGTKANWRIPKIPPDLLEDHISLSSRSFLTDYWLPIPSDTFIKSCTSWSGYMIYVCVCVRTPKERLNRDFIAGRIQKTLLMGDGIRSEARCTLLSSIIARCGTTLAMAFVAQAMVQVKKTARYFTNIGRFKHFDRFLFFSSKISNSNLTREENPQSHPAERPNWGLNLN